MNIKIDDEAMIEKYHKDIYGDEYIWYLDGFKLLGEHIISINENPILVIGNPYIIKFKDEEIYYNDNYMICGKGNNRKWREFRDEYIDGKLGEPYIMTYEELEHVYGEEAAKYIFDNGEEPEWL